jgi:beta-N-acetylglucosaminidase/uncharacterized protein YgiM (DUF1202 family)
MQRMSLLQQPRKNSWNHTFRKWIAIGTACVIPFTNVGLVLADVSPYGSGIAPTQTSSNGVARIQQYPGMDNFYQAINGTLFHFLGTPDQPTASFPVGPAPAFAKPNAIYVRDINHNFFERAADGDHLVGNYNPPYESLNLRLPSQVQASEIDQFIAQRSPNSPLIGYGKAFLDAQKNYGVNALYLAAHAILESAYGTSMIAVNKHNLFGYMAYDSDPYTNAAYFQTFNDSINWQAYFVGVQYLNPNGQWYGGSPNLDGMNVHYAADPLWAEKIAGIMNRIHPYNSAEYANATPLTASAGRPQGPVTDPILSVINATTPFSATGVTTDSVNFRSEPSTNSYPLTVLQPGTHVTITGINGNWYRATVGDSNGWIWKDYVKLDNQPTPSIPATTPVPVPPTSSPSQGTAKPNAVTTDDVNFRSAPNLTASVYQVVKAGTPLTILTVTQDNWYKVRVGGQTGWIYRDYVKLSNPSNSNISIWINGEEQSYDPSPLIVNGRTLVPLRAILERFGATVSWNGQTQTVTATKGTESIQLTIGSNIAKINGKSVSLDSPPQIYHNRTLVPLRFISESLGASVQWDALTRHVFITQDMA